jgi:hypothetical protein
MFTIGSKEQPDSYTRINIKTKRSSKKTGSIIIPIYASRLPVIFPIHLENQRK